MPVANPIANGSARMMGGAVGAPGTSPQGSPADSLGGSVSRPAARDSTPVHVGACVIVALGVVILLQLGGFRFVFDVGMGRQ